MQYFFPMDLLIENTTPSQKDSTQFHSELFSFGPESAK